MDDLFANYLTPHVVSLDVNIPSRSRLNAAERQRRQRSENSVGQRRQERRQLRRQPQAPPVPYYRAEGDVDNPTRHQPARLDFRIRTAFAAMGGFINQNAGPIHQANPDLNVNAIRTLGETLDAAAGLTDAELQQLLDDLDMSDASSQADSDLDFDLGFFDTLAGAEHLIDFITNQLDDPTLPSNQVIPATPNNTPSQIASAAVQQHTVFTAPTFDPNVTTSSGSSNTNSSTDIQVRRRTKRKQNDDGNNAQVIPRPIQSYRSNAPPPVVTPTPQNLNQLVPVIYIPRKALQWTPLLITNGPDPTPTKSSEVDSNAAPFLGNPNATTSSQDDEGLDLILQMDDLVEAVTEVITPIVERIQTHQIDADIAEFALNTALNPKKAKKQAERDKNFLTQEMYDNHFPRIQRKPGEALYDPYYDKTRWKKVGLGYRYLTDRQHALELQHHAASHEEDKAIAARHDNKVALTKKSNPLFKRLKQINAVARQNKKRDERGKDTWDVEGKFHKRKM